ncbi:MAG TPA: SDR family NAD(P)-dependent oxidoreductase [Acidimicrobiia bacterium]|nr:SDR family NAD(P)-dependent oxidoreductase [Acidimicrobiia bacterium]
MTDRGNQTVLTTGANSGIGLATVLEVARRGYRSVGTVRTQEKAEAVKAAARDGGVKVETEILDVTHADAVAQLIDRHRPYGLVNNAGYSITGAIEDVTDDEARAALETMVLAPVRLARLAIPHMRERGEGRIVNVSSIYGRVTTPLTGWYQGAKHALEALTDALRMEVAGSGIRVVLVEPGGFRTGIWEETERQIDKRAGSRFDSAYRRTLQSTRLAQPIMGDPGQVARVIAGALSGFTRPRYLVGYDAAAIALWSRLTPTEIKDRLQRLVLGL